MACDGALRDPGGRHDVAARPASDAIAARRSRATRCSTAGSSPGTPTTCSRGSGGNRAAFQDYCKPADLPSGAARAGVFGAPLRRVAADRARSTRSRATSSSATTCWFLSTYVLSALGTYLLARELTERPAGGVGRGRRATDSRCYRLPQARPPAGPVIAVDAALPSTACGASLRRCAQSRSAGAVAALIAQNLSCGYYMVYLTPFVGLYCLYELADRGIWSRWRESGRARRGRGTVALATWPCVKPYLCASRAAGFRPRPVGGRAIFGGRALAADRQRRSRVWGWLQTYPQAEAIPSPESSRCLLAGVALFVAARELKASTASCATQIGRRGDRVRPRRVRRLCLGGAFRRRRPAIRTGTSPGSASVSATCGKRGCRPRP